MFWGRWCQAKLKYRIENEAAIVNDVISDQIGVVFAYLY